jgi:hypothetical protein
MAKINPTSSAPHATPPTATPITSGVSSVVPAGSWTLTCSLVDTVSVIDTVFDCIVIRDRVVVDVCVDDVDDREKGAGVDEGGGDGVGDSVGNGVGAGVGDGVGDGVGTGVGGAYGQRFEPLQHAGTGVQSDCKAMP